jgi:hypothetical protein
MSAPAVRYITKPHARRLREELRSGIAASGRPLSDAVRRSHVEKLRQRVPVMSRQAREVELAEIDELELTSALPSATLTSVARHTQTQPGDDLYVMRYIGILPNVVKIGRSANPETRRRTLETSQAFRVEIVAVFPQKGYLESEVHRRLSHRRSTRGAGTEWFDVDAQRALDTIVDVIDGESAIRRVDF